MILIRIMNLTAIDLARQDILSANDDASSLLEVNEISSNVESDIFNEVLKKYVKNSFKNLSLVKTRIIERFLDQNEIYLPKIDNLTLIFIVRSNLTTEFIKFLNSLKKVKYEELDDVMDCLIYKTLKIYKLNNYLHADGKLKQNSKKLFEKCLVILIFCFIFVKSTEKGSKSGLFGNKTSYQ